jgi:hypothetical protein
VFSRYKSQREGGEEMTKKITISIPDNLHKQVNDFRESINISKTCAEALRVKIEEIDSSLYEAKKRFNLLELSEYIKMAHEDGLNWAGYRASSLELAIVCNWTYDWVANDKICKETMELLEENNDEIREVLRGYTTGYEYILENSFITKGVYEYQEPTDDAHIQIAISFVEGASIIWNKIKNQMIPKLTGG